MNLSDIRQLLGRNQIQLTKSLGQNFLHDQNQLERIGLAAELTGEDQVLEIGPGLGPLTEVLLQRAGKVLAIEKDRRLAGLLRERLGSEERLELVEADALDYIRDGRGDWSDWKMVSNLPYSVASPILVELAAAVGAPERMVATLQAEVARRIVAGPGGREYGLLSLLIQIAYEPGDVFKIPAGCFFPEPDVESACVTLRRRKEPLLSREERVGFTKIVKRGFSQRRKMMVKLLKADWPLQKVLDGLDLLGLDPKIRAEKVGLDQFVQLAKHLGS